MILIIFWVICFCITLGWNFQQNKEIKFFDIIIGLIFGPILTLASIGVVLRSIHEHLNKE